MKRNPMLARIEAAAEARYQIRFHKSMDMLLQMGQDAAGKLSTTWPAAWWMTRWTTRSLSMQKPRSTSRFVPLSVRTSFNLGR